MGATFSRVIDEASAIRPFGRAVPWWGEALLAAGPLAVGMYIGYSQRENTAGMWYKTLNRWVFPVAWTLLYSAMGYASLRAYRAGASQLGMGLYAAQLLANFAWTPIFFEHHNISLAAKDMTALIGLVGATAFHFNKVDPMSAQLLYPYLAWLGYAGAINLYILKNNGAGKKQL
ncbi:hypothetical protein QBZ16_002392 [Prototheca wickerhamii]|uniref:Uncharacterized protein n=1 Tax=Prototheca wickerhamii TaxID=3111 RepID=A0AAD9MJJ8_PROWI|nr:hypothetical protein QBZ16_002392 [Prototheca wickerhamii]